MTIDYRLVYIVDADNGIATVRDQLGKEMSLRTDVLRVGTLLPSQGQRWIIDRTLGDWTFSALISSEESPGGGGGAFSELMLIGA